MTIETGHDSRGGPGANLRRQFSEGGQMDRPIERRLDERAAARSEALAARRVLEEIMDRVAKLDRVIADQQVTTVLDRQAFARFGRRDDRARRGEIGEDLDARPAPVGEGRDADRGVSEDRQEVWDESGCDDIPNAWPRWLVRPHEQEPNIRQTRGERAEDELGRFAVRDVVEVPDERDRPRIARIRQRGDPLEVRTVRQDADPALRIRTLRDEGPSVRIGRHEGPRRAADRLDLVPLRPFQQPWLHHTADRAPAAEPTLEEGRVLHLVVEEVPVHVVLVEDHRYTGPVLVEADQVEGLHDDEVRWRRRLARRKVATVVPSHATDPGPEGIGERHLDVLDA